MVNYAGGYDPYPQQQALVKEPDLLHDLTHQLGGTFGYGTLLLAIGIGLVVLYKKKIKNWMN
jgi:hypothetical protein